MSFKLSKLMLVSMFSTLLGFPLTVRAEDHPLIGVSYPPFPEEVEEIGSWSVEGPYIIDQISLEGKELLLLSNLIKRDTRGKGSYKVVDVLPLPLIDKTETIKGSGSMCTVNGKEEPNIIVVVKIEDKPKLTKVSQAWRVENEKFNEIKLQGLRFECENFGHGL